MCKIPYAPCLQLQGLKQHDQKNAGLLEAN